MLQTANTELTGAAFPRPVQRVIGASNQADKTSERNSD